MLGSGGRWLAELAQSRQHVLTKLPKEGTLIRPRAMEVKLIETQVQEVFGRPDVVVRIARDAAHPSNGVGPDDAAVVLRHLRRVNLLIEQRWNE